MNRYWAVYGRAGHLGCFESRQEHGRGDRVAVRSPRGREVAEILDLARDHLSIPPDGEVLSNWSDPPADVSSILAEATEAAKGWPVLIADAEQLLDGIVILHVIRWESVDLSDWVRELSERLNRELRLLDITTQAPQAAPTCGKNDCGSAGCGTCGNGCSSGGCSQGIVKSRHDLTDYFLTLRKQMEKQRLELA